MTKKNSTNANRIAEAHVSAPLAHRLDLLLHTMKCIAQYEDRLCELSHEARRNGTVSAKASEELIDILDRMPSEDYLFDLDAIRDALSSADKPAKRSSVRAVPGGRSKSSKRATGRVPSK
jgi:hypothetical protein